VLFRVSDGEEGGNFKQLKRCVLEASPLGREVHAEKDGWSKIALEGGGGFGCSYQNARAEPCGRRRESELGRGRRERSKGTVDLRAGQEIPTFRVLVGGWERWGWMQDRTGQS
jgi:hypothetical protein